MTADADRPGVPQHPGVSLQDLVAYQKAGKTLAEVVRDVSQGEPGRVLRTLPDDTTLATAFYAAARSETVQRLGLRETTFTFWISTLGVIGGFALKMAPAPGTGGASQLSIDERVLALIPLLSVPFTFLVTRHTLIVQWLSGYIRGQLDSYLRQARSGPTGPLHWDSAHSDHTSMSTYLLMEEGTYYAFLIVPALLADVYVYRSGRRWHDFWFLADFIFTAITVLSVVALAAYIRYLRARQRGRRGGAVRV
jgi:hypothetical protein